MNIEPIPYLGNAKKHSVQQLYKIALSIKNFGGRQPIVVDKNHVIIVGHGRQEAYEKFKQEMNLPEPRIEVAEDLTEEQANAYRLADNLLVSSDYDVDVVNSEIQQLSLPFQDMLQFDFETTKKPEEQEQEKITDEKYFDYINQSIRQIVCHYPNAEFVELMKKTETLLKEMGLESNSELFKKLVEDKYGIR